MRCDVSYRRAVILYTDTDGKIVHCRVVVWSYWIDEATTRLRYFCLGIDLSGSELDLSQLVQTTCFSQPPTAGVTLINGVLTGTTLRLVSGAVTQ